MNKIISFLCLFLLFKSIYAQKLNTNFQSTETSSIASIGKMYAGVNFSNTIPSKFLKSTTGTPIGKRIENVFINDPKDADILLNTNKEFELSIIEDVNASLQPNVLHDQETQLTVKGLSNTTLSIQILNNQGQVVALFQEQTAEAYYQSNLTLPSIPGIYCVRLETPSGYTQSLKVLKR